GAEFAINKFDEVKDSNIRKQIILALTRHGGEKGQELVISKLNIIDNLDIIREIICRNRSKKINQLILDLYNTTAQKNIKEFLRSELEIRE
ncbi:MAG: hypothetical protein AAB731_01825, partial [Patescibacteria group bacterium]